MKYFLIVSLIFSFNVFAKHSSTPIEQGLSLFKKDVRNSNGSDKISVLKINPKNYKFKLIAFGREGIKGSFPESVRLRKFLKKFQYKALTNSSMFKKDYLTSVGYLKDFNYLNNDVHNPKYPGIIAFNPKSQDDPELIIIDKINDKNWAESIKNYETVIENFRTIVSGKNVWKPGKKKHKLMFQLAVDPMGMVYFIGYEGKKGRTISDFNNLILKNFPEIESAVYLDGGPHGIIQIQTPGHNEEFGAKYKAFSPNFILIQDR